MKYLNKILAVGLFLVSVSVYADVPQPYSLVHNISATPYYVQDGYILYNLISSRSAAVVLDVGSQDGGVARYIAQQASSLPSLTTIYSVNSWVSSNSSEQHLFQRFLSNVNQENTTNLIIPIRMGSIEAATALNIKADFISVVGGNDKDILYKDILAWYSHLTSQGVICGNNWHEGSAAIGVTNAAQALEMTLQVNGNVWYLDKSAL